MKNIKVLGSGCTKCKTTTDAIHEVATKLGVEVEIEKVEDFAKIAAFGVMSTPSVVIDGVVVHVGSVPTAKLIEGWLG